MPFLFGSQTRTTTNTPTFTPGQTALQGQTGSTLSNDLANPSAQIAPLQATATNEVNANYAGQPTAETQALSQRGGSRGNSKIALNPNKAAVSEASTKGTLASQFAGYQINQQNVNMQDALKYAFSTPGSTQVAPGSGWASGIGSLLGGAASFLGAGGGGGLFGGGPDQNTPTWNPADGSETYPSGGGQSTGGGLFGGLFGGGPDQNTPTWNPANGQEVYPSGGGG